MGLYFQPGNLPFKKISSKKSYVDRTALIGEINRQIDNGDNLICLSLSRRSGKTWHFRTLYSYYDESCDSSTYFDGTSISKDPSYKKHLNKYIVIRLDMAVLFSDMPVSKNIRDYVEKELKDEALNIFPNLDLSSEWKINVILSRIVSKLWSGSGFRFRQNTKPGAPQNFQGSFGSAKRDDRACPVHEELSAAHEGCGGIKQQGRCGRNRTLFWGTQSRISFLSAI